MTLKPCGHSYLHSDIIDWLLDMVINGHAQTQNNAEAGHQVANDTQKIGKTVTGQTIGKKSQN